MLMITTRIPCWNSATSSTGSDGPSWIAGDQTWSPDHKPHGEFGGVPDMFAERTWKHDGQWQGQRGSWSCFLDSILTVFIYILFIYFLVPIHPSHLVCVRVFVWRAELVLCISIFVQSFTSAEAGSDIFSQQSTKCSRKTTSNQLDLRHVFHPHSTMTVHDY